MVNCMPFLRARSQDRFALSEFAFFYFFIHSKPSLEIIRKGISLWI